MTIAGQNFEMFQGDNKELVITVYKQDGVSIQDLTGYNAVWCAHNQTPENPVIIKTTSPGEGITIPDPSSGQLVIELANVDTNTLTPKTYGHQCEVEDALGNHATVTTGYMKLSRSITHHLF